eukprot:TRINITY_DN5325_c0_g1_i1.p2 TRINITY_DN5325_c0_g1~~TRINITY_DN5325_c0_g1_i1.p2  ORF type:complete len:121 (-),score=16.35 TRINITY_DN5325_c0_g1_i1:466-828(-)
MAMLLRLSRSVAGKHSRCEARQGMARNSVAGAARHMQQQYRAGACAWGAACQNRERERIKAVHREMGLPVKKSDMEPRFRVVSLEGIAAAIGLLIVPGVLMPSLMQTYGLTQSQDRSKTE